MEQQDIFIGFFEFQIAEGRLIAGIWSNNFEGGSLYGEMMRRIRGDNPIEGDYESNWYQREGRPIPATLFVRGVRDGVFDLKWYEGDLRAVPDFHGIGHVMPGNRLVGYYTNHEIQP
jgi:hypothetical protein